MKFEKVQREDLAEFAWSWKLI